MTLALALLSCGAPELEPEPADSLTFETEGVPLAPPPALPLLTTDSDLVPGSPTWFVVSGVAPGSTVALLSSDLGEGAGSCPPILGGLCLDLVDPVSIVATATATAVGVVAFEVTPSGPLGAERAYQAVVAAGASSLKTAARTFVLGGCVGGAPTGHTGAPDTGSGATMVSGPDHTLVYSAWPAIGIDWRSPVDATFTGDALSSYVWPLNPLESPTSGTCTVSEVAVAGSVGIGRWHDGTMGGDYFGNNFPFGLDEGWHYAISNNATLVGPIATSGAFTQVAATPPTSPDGSVVPGVATATAQVTAGDPPQIALEIVVQLDGETYTIQSAGYPTPASSQITWSAGRVDGFLNATGTGGWCAGACQAFVQGYFADGGQHLALGYQIPIGERVSGVVVLAAP